MAILSHVPNMFQTVPNLKKLWNTRNPVISKVIHTMFQCSKYKAIYYIFFYIYIKPLYTYFYTNNLFKFGTLEQINYKLVIAIGLRVPNLKKLWNNFGTFGTTLEHFRRD